MDLLSLIPGGSLTVLLGGIVAALLAIWKAFSTGKRAGRDQQRVKEAEARAKNLDRIRDAADARPAGDVSIDPRNRDNR